MVFVCAVYAICVRSCLVIRVTLLFSVAVFFFFFKQKTAYEMRISDWSSDVCSSDLQIAGMQPAFLVSGFLPPPASFALVLIGQYRAGAGLAADADETALVQAVVGDFQHADVAPDFLAGHLRQRVELVQRVVRCGEGRIQLQHRYLAACAGALIAALPGSPGADGGQFASQWLDLANSTAFAVTVTIETEQAFLVYQWLQQCRIGGHDFDGNAVVIAHLLDETVDRKSVVSGKSVSVRVDLVGRGIIKKKQN